MNSWETKYPIVSASLGAETTGLHHCARLEAKISKTIKPHTFPRYFVISGMHPLLSCLLHHPVSLCLPSQPLGSLLFTCISASWKPHPPREHFLHQYSCLKKKLDGLILINGAFAHASAAQLRVNSGGQGLGIWALSSFLL